MATPQQLVDNIRSFLKGTDQTYRDQVKDLADEYAQLCLDANDRLRRCEEFLNQGLRSEAIQFAQTQPVLLDLVSLLDFAERSQWEEFTALYQLASPPALRLDAAEMLNRAYAEEQPLESLLRKHRLLALARAPLADRVEVLNLLASLDATNPIWRDDLDTFSRARFEQMEGEIETAVRAGDAPAMLALYDELRAVPWSIQAPQGLVERLAPEAEQERRRQTRERLRELAHHLERARRTNDLPLARQLAQEWHPTSVQFQLVPTDPLAVTAAPALKWLSKQENRLADEAEYNQAVADLREGIVHLTSLEQLEEYYTQLSGFPAGVPRELEDRYQERVAYLQGRNQRWENIILSATLLAGIIGLIVLYLLIASKR